MKKIDKTKMDYDFLNNYIINHCEELTEITEENKPYFRHARCFWGDWCIGYFKRDNEKYYRDLNDSNVYYRIGYNPDTPATDFNGKRKEHYYIEICYIGAKLDEYSPNHYEEVFYGYKTTETNKKYTSKNDKKCDNVYNMIYTFLEYKKLNDKLPSKQEVKRKVNKI